MTTGSIRSAEVVADDTYVYGLVPVDASSPTMTTGVGDRPIELILLDDFAVLVSRDVDDTVFGVAEDLLAHSSVLDAAAGTGTVLPLAFGTFGPRAGEAVEWRRSLREAYRSSFDRVDGAVQYSLRVRYVEDVALAELLEEDPRIGRLSARTRDTPEHAERAAKLELGRRVVEGLEMKARADADRVLLALEPSVREVSVRERRQADDVVELAALVDRDRAERFESEVEALASGFAERARFRLVGPQAPYDFVGGPVGWD